MTIFFLDVSDQFGERKFNQTESMYWEINSEAWARKIDWMKVGETQFLKGNKTRFVLCPSAFRWRDNFDQNETKFEFF